MAIYRCAHCRYIGEVMYHTNTTTSCQKCGQEVRLYDTVQFVGNLINRYVILNRELQVLKAEINEETEQENVVEADNLPLHDSKALANPAQHRLLVEWFGQQKINPTFDYTAVDMSGYYDEAADKIGQNFDVLKSIISQINWNYKNNRNDINMNLKKFSQKEAQCINNICREFYSHTLFSRYSYQKSEKNLHIKLQSATPIRQFFCGEWLEWYALNQVLEAAEKKGKGYQYSCARGVKICFANEDKHELDVMLLVKGKQPIVIECKTGEYRRDIDKYYRLRKALNLPSSNFILLVNDIDEAQAKSLSMMYEITFLNLNMLPEYLKQVV